jgi:hypothetical protein
MRAGPWEPVLKPPYRHLVDPEAPAQRNGSIRLLLLLVLPVSSPRKRTRGPPLDSLPVLLWFELPVFTLEIIDAGLRTIQLILKIFHLPAELLMPRIQLLMPRIQIFVVGLKVAQACPDAFHSLCEVIRYVHLGHTVTSLSCSPVGVQVLGSFTKGVYHIQLIKIVNTLNNSITYRCVSCMHI